MLNGIKAFLKSLFHFPGLTHSTRKDDYKEEVWINAGAMEEKTGVSVEEIRQVLEESKYPLEIKLSKTEPEKDDRLLKNISDRSFPLEALKKILEIVPSDGKTRKYIIYKMTEFFGVNFNEIGYS